MGRIKALIAWVKALIATVRRKRPIVDHAFQAIGRQSGENGGRLVSVITLPGFLSFFPLLALAFAVAGYVARYDSGAQDQIVKIITKAIPGIIGSGDGQIQLSSLENDKAATGIVGLVGLVISGLSVISALRTATRLLWRLPATTGNFLIAKVKDLGVMVVLGLALVVCFTLTGVGTAAATTILDNTPLPDGGAGPILLRVATIALSTGGFVLLFAIAFRVLGETKTTWREVGDGALLAGIGFEVLTTFGAYYLQKTTSNPLYGRFAVVIGLLVYTNLVARLYVFAACWAVTAPYNPDTSPSGTADQLGVPAAGIPGPRERVPHERAASAAGTAAFGAVCGLAVVLTVRAARAILPKAS